MRDIIYSIIWGIIGAVGTFYICVNILILIIALILGKKTGDDVVTTIAIISLIISIIAGFFTGIAFYPHPHD